ncbi:hypothetical protein EGW08_013156 [Elysia chlorotica]|uniref:Torsin-1A-interacting protein 1/2 AAA+ activator domain-containing protein n=1 Tax=Elysia chlorotica TaxID=188477 RepID=A0A433TBW8_ELYCH|nr:hypothetical protein EGW08_013156 [Elysia chlorotica]
MPGRSPISPKSRSTRSPSANNRTTDLSESDEDVKYISAANFSTRSTASSHAGSQDDSLLAEDDDDFQEKSYSGSPHQLETKVRSRVGTRTRGSSSTSPGLQTYGGQRLYPDLSDDSFNSIGDGPSPKDGNKNKHKKVYPSLPKVVQDPESRKIKNMPSLQEKLKDDSSRSSNIFFFPVLVLIALILFIYFGGLPRTVGDTADANLNIFEKYIKGIDYLQKEFPQQSPRLWRTLKSSAKHVLNATDPVYPVVVLMAAPIQNFELTKCLAERVASFYQASMTGDSVNVKTCDIRGYKNLQDARQKKALDDEMTQTFSENGGKSFVIVNLQDLAPEAALILHGFCDNDNAPYKDVMILMTLHFSPKDLQPSGNGKFGEEDVEVYLRNLWGRGLVADKVGALLSRVGNNIVIIGEEASESVKKVCKI